MKKPRKYREESSGLGESHPPISKSNSKSNTESDEYAKCTKKLPSKRKAKKSSKKHDRKRHKKDRSPSSSSSASDSSTSSSSTSSSSESSSHSEDSENISKRQKKSDKNSDSGGSFHERSSQNKLNSVSSEVSGNKQSKVDGQNSKRDHSDTHNRSKWDSPNQEVDRIKRERSRRHDREDDNNRRRSNERRPYKSENSSSDRYSRQRNDYRDRNDRGHNRGYNDGRDSRVYRKEGYNDRTRLNDGNDRQNRSPRRRRDYPRRSDDDGRYEWGKRGENDKPAQAAVEKEKPNFGLSGKLAEDTNKVNGILIKYSEPPESRKPKRRWRLYPFKGEKVLPTLYIHRQSCYLVGRDRHVCDLPVDHPSCSKQHAALQYRLVPFERPDGTTGKRVRPYIIDLESANGTFLNNKKIEPKKYIELLEKDVIKFGFSTREYVMLHENSKEDQMDDDIKEEIQIKKEKIE